MTLAKEAAAAIIRGYAELPPKGRSILAALPGRGYITESDSGIHVDIYGTCCMDDFKADAKIYLKPFRGGQVWAGALDEMESIVHQVLRVLTNLDHGADNVTFSGHSLGAAVATFLCGYYKPKRLIRFAPPRDGDSSFVSIFKSWNIATESFAGLSDRIPDFPLGLHRVSEITRLNFPEVSHFDELGQHSINNIYQHLPE